MPSSVAGVAGVVDQLQVANDRSVRPVQYQPQVALGGIIAADHDGGGSATMIRRRHCRCTVRGGQLDHGRSRARRDPPA